MIKLKKIIRSGIVVLILIGFASFAFADKAAKSKRNHLRKVLNEKKARAFFRKHRFGREKIFILPADAITKTHIRFIKKELSGIRVKTVVYKKQKYYIIIGASRIKRKALHYAISSNGAIDFVLPEEVSP